jgi:nucleotide-binding universal stress UspA family protein
MRWIPHGVPGDLTRHGFRLSIRRRRFMKPTIKHILVPTDFSMPSEAAVDYAAALAAQGAWELYLPETPQVRERRHQDAKDHLWRIASPHVNAGVRVTTEVRFGSPTDEIVAAAIAYGSDLIVMGTHGRTGLPHLLLGSIAERVIRLAPCPVLAVREQLVTSEVAEPDAVAAIN